MRNKLNHEFWTAIRAIYGKITAQDWRQAMAILLVYPEPWPFLRHHAAEVLRRVVECTDTQGEVESLWCVFKEKCPIQSIGTQAFELHLKSVDSDFPLWQVKRTGWTRTIPAYDPKAKTADEVENVAQHSYKTALLAAVLCPQNCEKAFIMALIHDLAELQVGDIPPQYVSDKAQKHADEFQALQGLLRRSPCAEATGAQILELFCMYAQNDASIAQIVHIADKLDMAFQALYYEDMHHLDLQEFLDSAQNVIENTSIYESLSAIWHF